MKEKLQDPRLREDDRYKDTKSYLTKYNNRSHIHPVTLCHPSRGELIQIFTPPLGGVLLTLLGHIGFFALFGVLLVCAFVLTIKWRKSLLFE